MNNQTARRQLAVRLTPLALCLAAALVADARAAAGGQTSRSVQGNERPAALLSVENCADDGGSETLRSVVAGAVSGDTIDLSLLDCGVITLMTGEIEVPVDDLTISGPGRDALTIDGNYNGRVFRHSGAGTLTLSGVTVTHGLLDTVTAAPFRNGYGGCILSDHGDEYGPSPYGSVAIIDSTVTGCRVIGSGELVPGRIRGGGIAAAGTITVLDSTISDCHLDNAAVFAGLFPGGGGGALFANYLITVTDSLIADNTSKISVPGQMRGGGISAYGGVAISNSVVTRNFVGCDTSAIYCKFALGGGVDVLGPATISSSTISDNIAEAGRAVSGGGLGVRGNLSITDTTLSGNVAQGPSYSRVGGGMALNGGHYGDVSDTTVISGVTVTGNSSVKGGGLYAGAAQRLNISNSTISGNNAEDAGGGIYLNSIKLGFPYSAYPLKLSNSTITANVSTGPRGGGGIVDNHLPELGISDFQSSIVAGNINVVAGAVLDADLAVTAAAVTGANNLIVAASGVTLPLDTLVAEPMFGPLQDNGGPTWTHALQSGSPAIDAGNNALNLSFDQRGTDFFRVTGLAADIGAFEYQQETGPAPTVAKNFLPDSIGAGDVTSLTITLGNANEKPAVLSAPLTDTLPASLVVADPANAMTTCPSGVVVAESGSGDVSLAAGAVISAMTTCTITVSVTAAEEGDYTNVIPAGALQTDLGTNTDPASAALTVTPATTPDSIFVDGFEGGSR